MSKRIITAGSDPYPPFQDLLDDGSIVGMDIEKLRKVFAETPYELKITLCDMKDAFDAFEKKQMDSVFLIAETPERHEKGYIFSDFVRNSVTAYFSRNPDTVIESFNDITRKNLVFGYIPFFSTPPEIESLPKENQRHYTGTIELLKAVAHGEVDMASFDKDLCTYYVKDLGLPKLYESPKMTSQKALHMCFNDAEICSEFNKALKKVGF